LVLAAIWVLLLIVSVPVELPIKVLAPAFEERVVAPVEERVVKAAVEGVDAPMAVPLIPVEVVLKLPEVMVRLLLPREIEEALKPERLKVPLVAVRLREPEDNWNPLEAVSNCAIVSDPLLVVGIPFAPRTIAEVLLVPMFTVPLVVPVPAVILMFPPVPPVPVSLPATKLTLPPVPPVPDSNPPVRFNAPPLPAAALLDAGWRERELPLIKVVMSGERFPFKASCPVGPTVN